MDIPEITEQEKAEFSKLMETPIMSQYNWVIRAFSHPLFPKKTRELARKDPEMLLKIVPLIIDSCSNFIEVREKAADGEYDYFFEDPVINDPIMFFQPKDRERIRKTWEESMAGFTKHSEDVVKNWKME